MRNAHTEPPTEAFLRSITPCEEDRRLYTSAPWTGGFRWFRSSNIVPLERYRGNHSSQSGPDRAA
jgi:hypothetical protein